MKEKRNLIVKRFLPYIVVCSVGLATFSPIMRQAPAVTISGLEWRQVVDTTGISWGEMDALYDVATGELDTATTSIGLVDFTGWHWASSGEVAVMFSTFTGLSIDEDTLVVESNSVWAPEFLSVFIPTRTDIRFERVDGITTESVSTTQARLGIMVDFIQTRDGDFATVDNGEIPKSHMDDFFGFWMSKSTVEPIPEPDTVVLLGLGLAGLAGAEVRRRRKKIAVDKT